MPKLRHPEQITSADYKTDDQIGLGAKGLLTYLLRQPSGERVTISGLAEKSADEAKQVFMYIQELLRTEYLNREAEYTSDGSREVFYIVKSSK